MFNLFTPTVYELFLDIIRSEQVTNTSDKYCGYVPGVVPGLPQVTRGLGMLHIGHAPLHAAILLDTHRCM